MAKKFKKMPDTKECFVNYNAVRQNKISVKKLNKKATFDIGHPEIGVRINILFWGMELLNLCATQIKVNFIV